MPFAPVYGDFFIPSAPRAVSTTVTITNNNLNTVGGKLGAVVSCPLTDTVTKIGFQTLAINAGDVDVRLETVDPATGYPSGTLWGTGTNSVLTLAGTEDNQYIEVTLDNPASVNMGDLIAIVLVSGTASLGTFNSAFTDGGAFGLPQAVANPTGSTWASVVGCPTFSLTFGTAGLYPIDFMYPIYLGGTVTANNASANLRFGNKITPSSTIKVKGCWIWSDVDGDMAIKLYDTDGSTVLATALNGLNTPAAATAFINFVYFDTEVTLNAGSTYYLAGEPTTATNTIFYYARYAAVAAREAYAPNVFYTSYNTGTGTWTDDTTWCAFMGLMVSGIETGGAGGGLITHPGMSGGMRG